MKLLVLLVGVFILQASSQTLPCQVTGGTSCPTMICPNTAVNYTCNVGSYAGSTNWNVPSVGGCSGTTLILAQGPQALGFTCLNSSSSAITCGPFTVTNTPPLTSNVYCLTSTLSVMVTSAMNGLVVSCSNYSTTTFTTTPVGNAAISVVAPPAAPKLTWSKVSSDQFTVMLEPVSTATSYNVSVNGSTLISLPASNYSTNYSVSIGNGTVFLVSFPSNGTLLYMLNFTNLINDTVYIVSVVAINCAGSSSPATITGTLRDLAPSTTTTTPSSSNTKGNQPSIGAPSIGAILLISVAILLMETFNCQ